MVAWGIVTTCMGTVENYHGLLIARIFLGVAESGQFPGVVCEFEAVVRPYVAGVIEKKNLADLALKIRLPDDVVRTSGPCNCKNLTSKRIQIAELNIVYAETRHVLQCCRCRWSFLRPACIRN